jgi:iron complex transport system permease protein
MAKLQVKSKVLRLVVLLLANLLLLALAILPVWSDPFVLQLRLPAVGAAVFSGAALAVAGMLLQTYFRNPLAGPYVLGSSSGAALGVALGTMALPVVWMEWGGRVVLALAGALAVTLGVVALARRASSVQVLVAGMLLAQVCGACISILVRFADEKDLRSYTIWTQGSFYAPDMQQLMGMIVGIFLGFAIVLLKVGALDAQWLGEEGARFSGRSGPRDRMWILGASAWLSAVVVAWCGPVAMVGLVTPLLVQSWMRTGLHRFLIPANLLLGSFLALAVLHLQRLAGNPQLPLDAIGAVVSIPILLAYLWKRGANA